MKHRFKKLGFISIELVILASIVMTAGGIGISKLAQNATGVMNVFNDSYYDELEATKSELTVKIIGRNHVNYLYDVGEKNLSDEDVVQINGIDCYVLKVEDDKAMLITKNMYNVRFDEGGHTSAEVEGHIGTHVSYTDKTYDYKYSTLRTWMNNFYVNKLGADSRILPTTITYYTKDSYTANLDSYAAGTIANEYAFALDAKEAKQYSSKFKWSNSNKQVNDDGSLSSYNSNYFWTTAGYRDSVGGSNAWSVRYDGGFYSADIDYANAAVRPVFWVSLD